MLVSWTEDTKKKYLSRRKPVSGLSSGGCDRFCHSEAIRMNICIFTPSFYPAVGGAERDADVLARGFLERGHRVGVLAQRMPGRMPELPYPVRQYSRPPAQHLWPEVLSCPLRAAYRKWRFDLILAFYAYPTGYVATRVGKKLGTPVVVTPQGGDLYPDFHALRKPRVPSIIRQGYSRADRIVSISAWLTQRLREICGDDLPPVDIVPNGIDLAKHDAEIDRASREPPALPIERPFILHLARVVPVKQQMLAVDAVHRLRGEFEKRSMKYAIVGDGNAADEVRALIKKHDLGSIVKMLGTRTGLDKAWLMSNAHFGASTSRREGLPNVVIEMMASGQPMLLSDIGPHRELAEGRGWGELFKTGDIDDLCAKMKTMIERDLAPMRTRAMELRQQYTIDRMVDGYVKACLTALESAER